MNNSNQNLTNGSSDGSSFGANLNSNSTNSPDIGAAMNLPMNKNMSTGQHLSFDGPGNQDGDIHDESSVTSKQDDDSSVKGGKGKKGSKSRKKNSNKMTRNISTGSASPSAESSKGNSGNDSSLDVNGVGNANDIKF